MIVYFDGYCNVCNRFIDFLIRRDRKRRLKYAPLQGRTAEKNLPAQYTSQATTMLFQDGDKLYVESSAAIRTIAALGGVFSLMSIFLLVPAFVRDGVYRWVANHRYLWFGKRDTCRIATPEERTQFLD